MLYFLLHGICNAKCRASLTFNFFGSFITFFLDFEGMLSTYLGIKNGGRFLELHSH
jgi:hypothetical protein